MSDIEKVKSALDITQVISQYVDLKPSGSNLSGLCPFHNEKTPSFMVNPSLQIYKCFGCGKAGDTINFIQEIERLEFPEALKKAAEMAGITLEGSYKKDEKLEKEKQRYLEANKLAADFYHHILLNHSLGKVGRDYANKRNISGKELVDFKFGYAPKNNDNLKNFLIKKGFSIEELISIGLIIERNGETVDKFRDRLLQPIFSLDGSVIGFSGRYLGSFDKAPKYLNSAESLVYKKNEALYGLYHAKDAVRKNNFAILVEGNLDVVSSFRAGADMTVAPLGTAITANQLKLLKRFTENVYFAFDNDNAGFGALIRGITLAEQVGLQYMYISVAPFQDCDELINENPDEWANRIANPQDAVIYVMQKYAKELDLGTAGGKTNLKKKMIPILQSIKDKVRKEHYVKELSLLLEVSPDLVANDMNNTKQLLIKDNEPEEVVEEYADLVEKISDENKLMAMILKLTSMKGLVVSESVFGDEKNRELFSVAFEIENKFTAEIVEMLDPEIVEHYKKISMLDIGSGEIDAQDCMSFYRKIYKESIQKKIMHLRSELAKDEDNAELLQQLMSVMNDLKNL